MSLNWPLIVGRGILRDKALAEADAHADAIVAEVRRAERKGEKVNLTRVAQQTNVSRATLYRKLGKR